MSDSESNTSYTHKVQPNTALILFHGLTGAPLEMKPLAEHMYNNGFDVFVPCLSGHQTSISELSKIKATRWMAVADEIFNIVNENNYQFIAVGGLSFGSLLAIYLAENYPGAVNAVVILSCPLKFKSLLRENLLQILSRAPDDLLDVLPTVAKVKRDFEGFEKPRSSYPRHSIGAGARLVSIRRQVIGRLTEISAPIFVLQDPFDHHLSPNVPMILRKNTSITVELEWIPNGQHELTVGVAWNEVCESIGEFLSDRLCREK